MREEGGGRSERAGATPPRPFAFAPVVLRKDSDDASAVLCAAVARVVRTHGLLFAPADDVHLVKGYLVRLVEVAFHGLGARFADALIHHLVAARIRVAFDLDVVPARVGLEL